MRPIRPSLRLALAVVFVGATLVSCSSEEGGTGSASCAAVVEYGGHAYFGGGHAEARPGNYRTHRRGHAPGL